MPDDYVRHSYSVRHLLSLIANKKLAPITLKIGISSAGQKYLLPTTTTNGVNTSHAYNAMPLFIMNSKLNHGHLN